MTTDPSRGPRRRWRMHAGTTLTLLGLAAAGARPAEAADAGRPPNILLIVADDLGYSDLGCYGGEIETPNLDRLAGNGLRFTQCYNTARCWPSRSALLSGYYAQQINRDPAGTRPRWAGLLPQFLKPAGYRSYHSGKWHVDGRVLDGGFGRSYEVVDPDRYFGPKVHHLDDKPLPQPGEQDGYYSTKAIAQHGLDWLAEHEAKAKDSPFFLYLAFLSPHFPIQALPEDIDRYRDRYQVGWDVIRQRRLERQRELGIYGGALSARDPKTIPGWNVKEADLKGRIGAGEAGYAVAWDELTAEQKEFQATKMAIHAAMVDRMDREIGRVLDRLKETGRLDDTIILFVSDNGASAEQLIRGDGHDPEAPAGSAKSFLCLGPGWSTAANTPFRLHKSWNHEGGISTPLIAHWPAGIAARGELRHTPGHLVDIAPTLLELAKAPAPASWEGEPRPPFPGRSLAPAFASDARIERDFLFFKHQGNRALRVGDWKIVAAGPDSPWELYDLSKDRSESENLAAEQPEKLKELVATWERSDEEFHRQGLTAPGASEPRKKARGR